MQQQTCKQCRPISDKDWYLRSGMSHFFQHLHGNTVCTLHNQLLVNDNSIMLHKWQQQPSADECSRLYVHHHNGNLAGSISVEMLSAKQILFWNMPMLEFICTTTIFLLLSKQQLVTLIMSRLLLSRISNWSRYQSNVTDLLQIAEDKRKQLFTVKNRTNTQHFMFSQYQIAPCFPTLKLWKQKPSIVFLNKNIVLYTSQSSTLPVARLTIRDRTFFPFK